ncbi:MAG: restriction endonuclease [Rikenellaceae bacterium]|nr:restriction endonuclease [Rikenellaceae bacterium]
MRILIEEYQYEVAAIKDVLYGIDPLTNIEGKVSIHYVGYYYNSLLKDCVFILPKVLLQGGEKPTDGPELAFGKYKPEEIANLDEKNPLSQRERDFIYKFAVWIYRAIVVYKNDKRNDSSIIYHAQIAQVGKGQRRLSNTYLDILLSLMQFNRENQDFFFFILKNLHSGFNKINWTRTISTTTVIVQRNQPIYLNPVNKKRKINFDEELLIIFFSILNYIGDAYGFSKEISCQFDLIKGKQFETYLKGYGKTRLLQIKYKYFSDKALELWRLCFAFFDESRQIFINTEQKEYLLVKNFYIVFEAIIDELIGDKPLPDGMDKKQEDGKIVDHLFSAPSLIDGKAKQTYYIGDSKYYKIGHELTSESIYKQYTYARNVIQWNLDIFNTGRKTESSVRLRDDVTEGYNIIPNFFISAKMDTAFDYSNDGIEKTDRKKNKHKQEHFKNRLFDRDTLLLFHYDVNFLFVLSLYARNSISQKTQWKQGIRDKFRKEIQDWLQKDYDFYAMQAHPGVDAKKYIKEHFQEVLGKIYTPFKDDTVFSLALESANPESDLIRTELKKFFYIKKCKLGSDPALAINAAKAEGYVPIPTEPSKYGVLMVMMEDYDSKFGKFADGRIAIGLKMTDESMRILESIQSIGFILFHTRKDDEQHMFALTSPCEVHPQSSLDDSIYKNINTANLYLQVSFDSSAELDSSFIHSSKAHWTKQTRYDAQYEIINRLLSEP